MKISAFSYVHDGVAGGYPFVEATMAVLPFVDEVVWVDAASTDGTGEALRRLAARWPDKVAVYETAWGAGAGETLARLHALHADLCRGDVVLHFEADEVWDPALASLACHEARGGAVDLQAWRVQVEQNFQRVRWHPHVVHRVFPRGSVKKVGETTDRGRHGGLPTLEIERGLIWDVTNCFRDCWENRVRNQSALRGGEAPNLLAAPEHANLPVLVQDVAAFLAQPHWTWTATPLALPDVLRPLVGRTSYEPTV